MNSSSRLASGCVRLIRLVLTLILLAGLTVSSAEAARGRAKVFRNTVTADNNALLRGVMYNTDLNSGALPGRTAVTRIRDHGMNALHVYAETPFCPVAPGSYLNSIKTLRDWTGQDSLYLIVTIGTGTCSNWDPGKGWKRTGFGVCQMCNPGDPGCDVSAHSFNFNATFARCFWEKYAPALASSTHVVFEIQNEPHFVLSGSTVISQPSPPAVRDLQADMYNVIRAAAPSTPVLLFSYGSLHDPAGVQSDWNAVKSLVQQRYGRTLTAAAVAFHTYEFSSAFGQPPESVRSAIKGARARNIPLIGTEMPWGNTPAECGGQLTAANNPCLNFLDVAVHEEEEVSWLSFLQIDGVGHLKTPTDWIERVRKPIQQGENGNGIAIVWEPDFGTWPAVHQPPCGSTAGFKAWNGKWVSGSAQDVWIGNGPLTADRDVLGVWEEFAVSCLHGGAELKAPSISRFVDPGWTSDATPLWANATTSSASLSLRWLKLWDGSVALRAPRPYSNASRPTWRFVSADYNRTAPNPPELVDNRTRVGAWERFIIVSW